MQQIERYGVIALVLLLVTIVAISFWGDSKSPGFWSRLVGKNQPKKELVVQQTPPTSPAADPLPLAQDGVVATPVNALEPVMPGAQPAVQPLTQAAPSAFDQIVPVTSQIPTRSSSTAVLPGAQPSTSSPSSAVTAANPGAQFTAPAAQASLEYVVKKGDSLAKIAAAMLGDESRWSEIQALNAGVSPKNLAIGQKLKLPSGASRAARTTAAPLVAKSDGAGEHKIEAKKKPIDTGARSYVVKKGDSLREIAAATLGDAARWKDIVAANPGLQPNKLAVGQKLRLPSAPRGEVVATALPAAATKSTPVSSKPRVR